MKIFVLLLCLSSTAFAQSILPLYPEGIPCANARQDAGEHRPDIGWTLTDVHEPMLHHYAPVPRSANGGALMIIPGGGYWISAFDLEGVDIGRRFVQEGYHVFVLQYRLPGRETDRDCATHVALDDARRGVQTIRLLADSLGINPGRVAVMGFSAGGHLAASAAVHPLAADSLSGIPAERFSSRPDLSLPIYAVLKMDADGAGHAGSQRALLGGNPDPELLDYYNLPARVHGDVPPTFMAHAADDKAVPLENSTEYLYALIRQGVSTELHVLPKGGHGFGTGVGYGGAVTQWLDLALAWLSDHWLFEGKN